MEIKTIAREAADTSKGYTLQKLRTISLVLDEIVKDKDVDFIAAIEYGGDLYIGKDHHSYVEENKAYDSQNFSFVSEPIKNTLVYFLDYWLNNKKNPNIQFGIFCTNSIAKEINSGLVKDLAIDLPENKIIESLQGKDYSDSKTVDAAKIILLHEYKKQYEGNKNVSLEGSYHDTIVSFSTDEWIEFFDTIQWEFSDINIEDLENQVLEKIKNAKFNPEDNIGIKAQFIRAELFYQLELRQNKNKTEERFLTNKDIELIYYKVVNGEINDGSYKYLNINYDDLRRKTKRFLNDFIDRKYFAITKTRISPRLIPRNVAFVDPNLRITSQSFEQRLEQKVDISGSLDLLSKSDQPIFLLGELGSGKSTMAANYMDNIIDSEPEIVPIFIPTIYLSNEDVSTLGNLKLAINKFIKDDLQVEDESFDINNLIKSRKETIIIVDGLDELELRQTKLVINNLKNLKSENANLKIIATGRPIELEGVIPSGWRILSTTKLNEKEIFSVLLNESISRGNSPEDAKAAATLKLSYLKSRPQLYSIATTPLIICSLYEQLEEGISDKTLGDILYTIVREKLGWNDKDMRADEFTEFNTHYPTNFSKES